MAIQSLRGMPDLLGDDCIKFRYLENVLISMAETYAYKEIRTPMLEETALFHRSLGEDTDVIGKEMYSFEDANKQWLSLRPEGTAGCVRAGVQHGLFYNQFQSLWYLGPMFRRERPQKCRLRQFHQFGVELIGSDSLANEVELIGFTQQLWQKLALQNLKLEINTLGSHEDRINYRKALVEYFTNVIDQLTADEQHRLKTNPLRLLDSKEEHLQSLIASAPIMQDYFSTDTKDKYKALQELLTDIGIEFIHNPYLVRGLDYYNDLVFEWKTDLLGAQSTICAGGRYDGLIKQLHGKPCPAAGFAIGLERVIAIMQAAIPKIKELVVIANEDNLRLKSQAGFLLRSNLNNIKVITDNRTGSNKNQLKKAIKEKIDYALVIDNEHSCSFKFLQTNDNDYSNNFKTIITEILQGRLLNV